MTHPAQLTVPDDPRRLPDGYLACRACGVTCPDGAGPVTWVDVLGREGVPALINAQEAGSRSRPARPAPACTTGPASWSPRTPPSPPGSGTPPPPPTGSRTRCTRSSSSPGPTPR